MSILAILSGATFELGGTKYMDRAYGSKIEPPSSFNGLKSVVTTSVEATRLCCGCGIEVSDKKYMDLTYGSQFCGSLLSSM